MIVEGRPLDCEEELEWISNKDSFPAVEFLPDILSDHPYGGAGVKPNLHSPRRRAVPGASAGAGAAVGAILTCQAKALFEHRKLSPQCEDREEEKKRKKSNEKDNKTTMMTLMTSAAKMSGGIMGRKCQHCGAEKPRNGAQVLVDLKRFVMLVGLGTNRGDWYRSIGRRVALVFRAICIRLRTGKIIEMRKGKNVVGMR
ncbi:hypothetical protein F8388_026644 [Cannabis sativa]|uniref:Uncharacterized protein n=1 Tax=Cannabis sativa TaxID=3483 RepID=A0A7J6EAR0_CANSA|nr:hypothetical protein F8388_026644 [Cannabis sativa]